MTDAEIGALFDRYGPLVYRRALTLLGNPADAEEATQEVFIRALRGRDAFRGESQASTWLYRILTNYCLNLIRDRNRRQALRDAHFRGREPPPGAPPADRMLLLLHLLAEADPDCARAAIYVYVDDMSHDEAAELLGVSRRTVGNLVQRFAAWARARLQEAR